MVDLIPVTRTENIRDLAGWTYNNFRRIMDEMDAQPAVDSGEEFVTGSLELTTDIPFIYNVVASLQGAPVAGAAYVRAISVNAAESRGSDFGNIVLEVFTSAFVLSTTPVVVSWFAMGTNRIP